MTFLLSQYILFHSSIHASLIYISVQNTSFHPSINPSIYVSIIHKSISRAVLYTICVLFPVLSSGNIEMSRRQLDPEKFSLGGGKH